jgi:hypothetical protein
MCRVLCHCLSPFDRAGGPADSHQANPLVEPEPLHGSRAQSP